MQSRRFFIGKVASGMALAASNVLGANERIRVGIIGPGDRGKEILREAVGCDNIECVGAADVYTKRLEEACVIAPGARTYRDYRGLLEDKSIDAVLISTPQHLHAEHFITALDAGKHVYQEKTMAFTVQHAKKMRAAYQRAGKRVVQIGHQWTSTGQVADAASFLKPELMGKITAIHAHMYRNTPHGKPQWARPVYPDMTAENIVWNSFLGDAPQRPFDANRYINWRFFWDYSGGNVFENMVHQVGFWFKLLNLKIPQKVTMVGANYLSPGMQPPDTMDVSMIQREKILFTWNSMFGNNLYGEGYDEVLGDKGTILRVEDLHARFVPQGEESAVPSVGEASGKAPDIVGMSDTTIPHMQNFFDCVRSRKETDCPFELGFRSAITCRMAVDSYRQGRTVHWDEQKEEIV
jgi:predicted dehydrogenase